MQKTKSLDGKCCAARDCAARDCTQDRASSWSREASRVHEKGKKTPAMYALMADIEPDVENCMRMPKKKPVTSFNISRSLSVLNDSGKTTSAECCLGRLHSCVSQVRSGLNSCVIVPEAAAPKGSSLDHLGGGVHWIEVFDCINVFLLLEQAYHVPFELALDFGDSHTMRSIYFRVALTLFFVVDIILQFFTAFIRNSADLSEDFWQTDCLKVAARYISVPLTQQGRAGWFWIDFASITPDLFFVLRVIGDTSGQYGNVHGCEGKWRALNLLRILRLVKVLRLRRWHHFLNRMHAKASVSYFLFDFVKFVLISTLACHWFACAWLMAEGTIIKGVISYDSDTSWLANMIELKGDPCTPDAARDPWCCYQIALYWGTMTLTSVGYGDIVPLNVLEYSVCTISMLLSGYCWAYIIGSVVSLLSNLDPDGDRFKHQMDDMNELMHDRGMPYELQVRLRRYMHEAKFIKTEEKSAAFVEGTLSRGLQHEIARQSAHSHVLHGLYWAKAGEVEDDARVDLVRAFRPAMYPANELIAVPQTIVVICKGEMFARGYILSRGDTWGHENILLETEALIDATVPKAITSLSAMTMTKGDLISVASEYPLLDKRIRRAQVRTALFRAMLMVAAAVKLERSGHLKTPTSKFSSKTLVEPEVELLNTLGLKGAEGRRSSRLTPHWHHEPMERVEQTVDSRVGAVEKKLVRVEEKIDDLKNCIMQLATSSAAKHKTARL